LIVCVCVMMCVLGGTPPTVVALLLSGIAAPFWEEDHATVGLGSQQSVVYVGRGCCELVHFFT
jgi:hypothetical protein